MTLVPEEVHATIYKVRKVNLEGIPSARVYLADFYIPVLLCRHAVFRHHCRPVKALGRFLASAHRGGQDTQANHLFSGRNHFCLDFRISIRGWTSVRLFTSVDHCR